MSVQKARTVIADAGLARRLLWLEDHFLKAKGAERHTSKTTAAQRPAKT